MATKAEHTSDNTIPQSAEDITPSWVQQVLQRDLPGVIITDVDVKGSVSHGEGYLSDIIAFDAMGTRDGSSQCYNLVAKLTDVPRFSAGLKNFPTHIQNSQKELQIKLEAAEIEFYSSIVPELLSLHVQSTETKIKSKSKDGEGRPSADSFLLPKCYVAATDPTSKMSVRVMENLKAQGFSIKPNRQSLSREEMMLTVGALAQVHGLSHRLELHSGIPDKFNGILAESSLVEPFVFSYPVGVKILAAAFPDQADLIARLEKVNAQAVLLDTMEKSPRLKVLNHRDCWVNNIMFKYQGEVPIEVKLVDWQMIQYLPLTCDLAFLFLCSASWDAFHNHRDAILAHYHQELLKTLGPNESLRMKRYTLEELSADFKVDCLYGLVNCMFHLSTLRPDKEHLLKIQEISNWGVI